MIPAVVMNPMDRIETVPNARRSCVSSEYCGRRQQRTDRMALYSPSDRVAKVREVFVFCKVALGMVLFVSPQTTTLNLPAGICQPPSFDALLSCVNCVATQLFTHYLSFFLLRVVQNQSWDGVRFPNIVRLSSSLIHHRAVTSRDPLPMNQETEFIHSRLLDRTL